MFEKQSKNAVLVMVTDQFSCERIVNVGAGLAKIYKLPLHVVSVQKAGFQNINAAALEHLFNVTRSFGAEMNVFYDKEPSKNLLKYVYRFKPSHIVAGESGEVQKSPFYELIRKNNLLKKRSKVYLYVVDRMGEFKVYDAANALPE